jgi:F420-dependent oxidoreductase-like protein
MRFGIDAAQHRLTWDDLLARVRWAEEAGFDGAWVFDHFIPLYGEGPGPCMEAWTLQAALAASTERIRLGALVTGMTYRHPSVLAAEAVTVDHVSRGRVELGVGAAWHAEEHRRLGIDFPATRERVDRFDEGLQVLTLLMTEDDVHFDGAYYQLQGATVLPRPVQQPHPPIWVGADGPRMLSIAARYADVWHSFQPPLELARLARGLDEKIRGAGRDPSRVQRASSLSIEGSWDAVRRQVDAYAEVGVSYLVVGWPSDGQARVEEFVQQFLH